MKWLPRKERPLQVGEVFEKYTLKQRLGAGAMGAVYLAEHTFLKSLFAIKILAPEIARKNPIFVERFIREAKLACDIKHPNLIAVHDAGRNEQTGHYYIVMDYVSGGSLRDRLARERTLPVAEALRIVAEIASALEVAHAHKMVHRDIKPENIMFTAEGAAKLADLGIAKSSDEGAHNLTMEASVFGTPAYMSPEQAQDASKVDCRADLYSLGVVLFEMLSGRRPYEGRSMMEILSQVVAPGDVPDVRTVAPDVPAAVAELIRDMTAKPLEKRLESPTQLLARLAALAPASSVRLNPPQPVAPVRPDVTMPTVTADERPSVEVTMPTRAAEGASAPEVTMPTRTGTAVHPEVTMPTVGEPVERPDVTMPTVAGPSARPDVTLATQGPVGQTPPAKGTRRHRGFPIKSILLCLLALGAVVGLIWVSYGTLKEFIRAGRSAPVAEGGSAASRNASTPDGPPAGRGQDHAVEKSPPSLPRDRGPVTRTDGQAVAGKSVADPSVAVHDQSPTAATNGRSPAVAVHAQSPAVAVHAQSPAVVVHGRSPDANQQSPRTEFPLTERSIVVMGSLPDDMSVVDAVSALGETVVRRAASGDYQPLLDELERVRPRLVILDPIGYEAAGVSVGTFRVMLNKMQMQLRGRGIAVKALMASEAAFQRELDDARQKYDWDVQTPDEICRFIKSTNQANGENGK